MRLETSVRIFIIIFVLFPLFSIMNGAYAEEAAKEKAGEEAENEWEDKGEDEGEEKIARDSIVVWHLAAQAGVTDEQAISISGLLTTDVEDISGRKVVSEEDIQTILRGEEAKQKCGNQDTSCIAEIGSALGANEAISGDLGRVGKLWILNLRRINVREAKVMKRVSRKVKGSLENLVGVLPGAVEELFEKKKTAAKPKKDDVETEQNGFIGVNINLFLNPEWEIENVKQGSSGSGLKMSGDCAFSYGVTFGMSFYVINYIALGFDLDVNFWTAEADVIAGGDVDMKQIALDPTIRGAYQFGEEDQFEVYAKLGIGYSMFILKGPKEAEEFLGKDPQHGWNIKFLPGFKYTMGGFSLFVELGYYHAKYSAEEQVEVYDEYVCYGSDCHEVMKKEKIEYDMNLTSFMLAAGIGHQW